MTWSRRRHDFEAMPPDCPSDSPPTSRLTQTGFFFGVMQVSQMPRIVMSVSSSVGEKVIPVSTPVVLSHRLLSYNERNERRRFGLSSVGESGRRGFHPWHFVRIVFRFASRASTLCNIL